jgi:cobalt-zinc-cadmium efflux system outer membrane protein
MIPFPGKLTKAGKVDEFVARIARIQLDQAIRDVIISIRESVYELYYIRNAKQIARQNEKLLDHLRKVTETQYAQDAAALVDVVKAQSQVGQLRYDMLLLDDLEITEITKLNSVLNRSPEAIIRNIRLDGFGAVVFSLEEIYEMAGNHQEEIRIASERIKKAQAKADLARAKYLPDFNLGLFYAAIGEPDVLTPPEDAGRDVLGIQAGITLPLWFGKNKSRVNLANAEKRKAKASKERRINSTRANIRTLYFRFQNAERIIVLYRDDLIPQAARAMELSETFFKEGESSFSDFIETQSVWYNFQLTLARAQADYGKYIARLERLVGRDITRLGDTPSINMTEEEK